MQPDGGVGERRRVIAEDEGWEKPPTAASIPVVRSRDRRIRLGETAVGVSARSRRPMGWETKHARARASQAGLNAAGGARAHRSDRQSGVTMRSIENEHMLRLDRAHGRPIPSSRSFGWMLDERASRQDGAAPETGLRQEERRIPPPLLVAASSRLSPTTCVRKHLASHPPRPAQTSATRLSARRLSKARPDTTSHLRTHADAAHKDEVQVGGRPCVASAPRPAVPSESAPLHVSEPSSGAPVPADSRGTRTRRSTGLDLTRLGTRARRPIAHPPSASTPRGGEAPSLRSSELVGPHPASAPVPPRTARSIHRLRRAREGSVAWRDEIVRGRCRTTAGDAHGCGGS
ncbi:hypothetical protein DFH08DRAFT_1050518 [Mycena albidolilacea]|uniref:Uncharacterized protein n=1 Tax=Mycena albidolilacea TaxID=1033008 RepID=A0AAD6Z647_9AGAR|nr:hypothetical protein DFH08DRAFT_1050518 [Mycena albidolilacea]